MESFVQMSLREYDILKFNSEHLKRELKDEQESHSEDVAQAKKESSEPYESYEDLIETEFSELEVDENE